MKKIPTKKGSISSQNDKLEHELTQSFKNFQTFQNVYCKANRLVKPTRYGNGRKINQPLSKSPNGPPNMIRPSFRNTQSPQTNLEDQRVRSVTTLPDAMNTLKPQSNVMPDQTLFTSILDGHDKVYDKNLQKAKDLQKLYTFKNQMSSSQNFVVSRASRNKNLAINRSLPKHPNQYSYADSKPKLSKSTTQDSFNKQSNSFLDQTETARWKQDFLNQTQSTKARIKINQKQLRKRETPLDLGKSQQFRTINQMRSTTSFSQDPLPKNTVSPSLSTISQNVFQQNESRERLGHTMSSLQLSLSPKSTIPRLGQQSDYFVRGRQMLKQRRFKEAAALFEQQLESYDNCLKSIYNLSVAQLQMNQLSQSIENIRQLHKKDPTYSKSSYVVMAIALQRRDLNDSAVDKLQKCVRLFPKYIDAWKALGQLLLKEGREKQAVEAFVKVQQLGKEKEGLLGQAECYKKMGERDEAIGKYSECLKFKDKNGKVHKRAHLSRGYLLYKKGQYQAALSDLRAFKATDLETTYLIGKTLFNLEQHEEALLCFNTVALQNKSPVSGKAVSRLVLTHIDQNDFYSAEHAIQRFKQISKPDKFLNVKWFVEGVILLMRRKKDKALVSFKMIEDGACCDTELKFKTFNHMAYAYFPSRILDSIRYIQKAETLFKLEKQHLLNKYFILAENKRQTNKYKEMTEILANCELEFRKEPQVYKFQALALLQPLVCKISGVCNADMPNKKTAVELALKIVDRGLQNCPLNKSLLLLRGNLKFYLHEFLESLEDLDAVIDIEKQQKEPNAFSYLSRGRCQACLSLFNEALKDFDTAISLNKKLISAYFNRGKCRYLMGSSHAAFQDFQQMIILDIDNPTLHIEAGNLLMTTGNYKDAIMAYSNAQSIKVTSLAYYQRSRCFLANNQTKKALADLERIAQHYSKWPDPVARSDYKIMMVIYKTMIYLRNLGKPKKQNVEESQVFQDSDSVETIENQDSPRDLLDPNWTLTQAQNELLQISVQTKLSELSSTTQTPVDTQEYINLRLHQQLIPNVNLIRLEKQKAQFRAEVKKTLQKPMIPFKMKKYPARLEPKMPLRLFNYYTETIFSLEDITLYYGIFLFYSGDYKLSLKQFSECFKQKEQRKLMEFGQQEVTNRSEFSEFGLCALSEREASFNQILCYLMLEEYSKALVTLLKFFKDSINYPKECEPLYILHFLLVRILQPKETDLLKKLENKCYKVDAPSADAVLKYNKPVQLTPFTEKDRLCANFPLQAISLKLSASKVVKLEARPSFSWPFVKPPNMVPSVEEKVLEMGSYGRLMLEAPWVKRTQKYQLQFTDTIIEHDPLLPDPSSQGKRVTRMLKKPPESGMPSSKVRSEATLKVRTKKVTAENSVRSVQLDKV